jgi:hypothetical protein
LVFWSSYLLEQKLKEPAREKGLGRPPQAPFDLAIKNRRMKFCIVGLRMLAHRCCDSPFQGHEIASKKRGTVDHAGGLANKYILNSIL